MELWLKKPIKESLHAIEELISSEIIGLFSKPGR